MALSTGGMRSPPVVPGADQPEARSQKANHENTKVTKARNMGNYYSTAKVLNPFVMLRPSLVSF